VKLLSKTEFAKQCGVSQPAISKLIRYGKLTIVDGKVDLEGPDTVEYIRKRGEVSAGDRRNPNVGGGHGEPVSVPEPYQGQGQAQPQGKGMMSRAMVDLAKAQQDFLWKKLKNEEKIGTLAERAQVMKMWSAVETAFVRMLNDGAHTIAAECWPMAKGSQSIEQGEVAVRKILSGFIKSCKVQVKRALGDA
jgi:hypothetical protein